MLPLHIAVKKGASAELAVENGLVGAQPSNGPVGSGDGRLELWDVAALTTDPRAAAGLGSLAVRAAALAVRAAALDRLLYRQRSGLSGRGSYDCIGRHLPAVEQPDPEHPPALRGGQPQLLPQP